MLSCFLCGRSDSAIEPSPPHKVSPSSPEIKHCNAVNGIGDFRPLTKANLDVGSFDADAKQGALYCKSPRSSNDTAPRGSSFQDLISECAYPSDASECSSIQKEIVVKGKHTEEHSICTTEEENLDADLCGSDEEVSKEDIRQKDLKRHEAVDGVNELLSCSSRMPVEDNPNCYNVVSTCKSGCTETLVDALGEITSIASPPEEEEASLKGDVNAEFQSCPKMKTCGIVPKLKNVGYQTEKKGLKSYKHKEPTHLFSYGISDQQRDFFFLCAGLVIQAVGFQLKSIVDVVTTVILLGYRAYFFACGLIDSLSQIKDWLHETRTKLLSHLLINKHRRSLALHMEKLETIKPLLIAGAKRMGWGCITAAYVLALLTALLFISLVFSYFAVFKGSSTQKPIHITKELYFDYTKPHPVASLDLLSFNIYPKSSNVSKGIKATHMPSFRYHFTVFLTIPESDYNRNLGIFQVTSELSSETGDILSKASQPCMLHFKSNTLHYVKSICLAIPLLAGATSETQILSLPSLEWQQDVLSPTHASMLTISLVPRAGRGSRDGLPELYKAEIQVDSYWMSSSASGSSIRTLAMWIGLSFLLFGFLASLCMYKIHQKRSIC
ncbi:hypothetical protein GOP47_0009892 [Adiantum capillus-veneris]|uniref:Uncharacterized protein n=1 Tax=Adiantum capillus-veneris TaxID=13818 RepID=A0A9D4UXQ0_ADICA|nr:hypothetical protein GOP47_0009892 [Adiantum capillus-veneris]